tara:strand:+ start:818 stop:2962 length:2145 start_codon:yes stop_codon:yes gene_type:complete
MKKKKNLNEEIERIKSLFTEERLYGNLVDGIVIKEQNPKHKYNANSRQDISISTEDGLGKCYDKDGSEIDCNLTQKMKSLSDSTDLDDYKIDKVGWKDLDKYKIYNNPTNGYDYDPSGGLGASRAASNLPITGSYKGDGYQLSMDRGPHCAGKHHDSECNDRQKATCRSRGKIGSNRVEKGKVWDRLEGLGYQADNGQYITTGYGHWDNEDYRKCWCTKGKEVQVNRPCTGVIGDPSTQEVKLVDQIVVDTICSGCWQAEFTKALPRYDIPANETEDQRKKRMDREERIFQNQSRNFTGMKSSQEVKDDRAFAHIVLEISEIVTFFIPIVGVPISMALGGLNAGLYFAEGDNVAGGLSLAFALLPGGMAIRKGMRGNQRLLKSLDETTEALSTYKKIVPGEEVLVKNTLREKLVNNGVKNVDKVLETNKHLIDEYFTIITKKGAKELLEKSGKNLSNLVKSTGREWKAFTKNPDLLKKYMNSYGGRIDAAYIAYLKSLGPSVVKQGVIGSTIYVALLKGIPMALQSEAGQDLTKWAHAEYNKIDFTKVGLPISTTASRAKEGKIKDIVEIDGYNWDTTKQVFMSDSGIPDNRNLKKAWKAGWRPYDKNNPDETANSPDKYEEFWTPSFREFMEDASKNITGMDKEEVNKRIFEDEGGAGIKIDFEVGGGKDSIVYDDEGRKIVISPPEIETIKIYYDSIPDFDGPQLYLDNTEK